MIRRDVIGLIVIGVFLLILGVWSHWPASITPDAAMHAEIVELIKDQRFVDSWMPYADNEFTYPPLFHYIAWLIPLSGITAVRILGLLLWLLFPLSVYFLVSTYDKKAGLIGAAFIAVSPAFSNVFMFGEFPQLLGMFLLVWQWYFLRTGKVMWGAVFAGLGALAHVFVVFVAGLLHLVYFFKITKKKWVYLIVPGVVALPWAGRYLLIVQNALSGQWENVRYNAVQPVFGFWPFSQIVDFLFGLRGLGFLLIVLAVVGFIYVKDWWVRGFFIGGVILSVFHIPFTQLKFNDLLILPIIVLAAVGFVRLKVNRRALFGIGLVLVVLLGGLQVQHFEKGREYWFNPEIAPTAGLLDAAEWLGSYDSNNVRIYVHQASAWGGIVSGKLPMNPDVTHLEAFSSSYEKQLATRDAISAGLVAGEDVDLLLGEYNVQYVLVPFPVDMDEIYSNGEWYVYRR